MTLLHDYVIIEPITQTKTASGLIIPVQATEKQLKGVVKYVGTDVEHEEIKEGAKVIFDKLNSSPAPENDGMFMCQEQDVIAIL